MILKISAIFLIFAVFLNIICADFDFENSDQNIFTIDLKIPVNYNPNLQFATNPRNSRITNGNSALNGQFPFATFLHIQRGSSLTFCTGSLLSSIWIITARTCFVINPNFPADSLLAFLGSNDMQSASMINSFSNRGSWYNNDNGVNPNIALFRLAIEMPINSLIRPIRVPRLVDENFGFDDFNVTTVGWGRLANNSFPRLLQFANFRILAIHLCYWNRNFSNYDFCSQHQTLRSMTDTERDIGGASVIVEGDGQMTLVGITSEVIGLPNGLAVSSVRVSSFLRFIHNHTEIPFR